MSTVTVYIDLPLFAPPGETFALATGEVAVSFVPTHLDTFPWPAEWAQAHPTYVLPDHGAVLGARPWKGSGSAEMHVSLCGFVFESQEEAVECATFLQSLGLQLHDLRSEA
ncbi:hypothetical protein PAGU2638_28420 [Lysobacter sp. PAGU 2638]